MVGGRKAGVRGVGGLKVFFRAWKLSRTAAMLDYSVPCWKGRHVPQTLLGPGSANDTEAIGRIYMAGIDRCCCRTYARLLSEWREADSPR